MAKQEIDSKTLELPIRHQLHGLVNVTAAANQVEREAMLLEDKYDQLKHQELALKAMGVIYAGTTMKDGKYLYLVYPSLHGEPRVRKYVGADKDAIAEAFASIRRGEELLKVQREIKEIENQVHNAEYQISRLSLTVR